jgi:hypothetical protein
MTPPSVALDAELATAVDWLGRDQKCGQTRCAAFLQTSTRQTEPDTVDA